MKYTGNTNNSSKRQQSMPVLNIHLSIMALNINSLSSPNERNNRDELTRNKIHISAAYKKHISALEQKDGQMLTNQMAPGSKQALLS